MTRLSDVDRIALNRCVEIMRLDPTECARIDRKLSQGTDYWRDVAMGAAYHLQIQKLGLQPWENPPCVGDVTQPRVDQSALDLLRRLQSLNLSRFEPDPVRACEAAEKKQQAAE